MIAYQPLNYHLPLSPYKSEPDTSSDQAQPTPTPLKTTQPSDSPDNSKLKSKIKSSLCKNFMQQGYCPYGNKCQFAHGPQQLRCNTISNTSYKTKPCFSFLNKGFCPYGHRCNFIHIHKTPQNSLTLYNTLQNFPEIAMQKGGANSRLLSKMGRS